MSASPRRDKALSDYRAKRDFSNTPEPEGRAPLKGPIQRRFVVQRHRARRLHYDFRLEVDEVLASWAMPKGPSMDPSVRSLAVHVEDHPLEYRDFEGVIPKGQYGAGDVIVWDRGHWEPAGTDDPASAIADGELHFDLHGEKLRGRFVLVRTRPDGRGQEQWLVLHKHDDFAVKGWSPEDHPRSVKSGRTNDEVGAAPGAVWHGDRPAPDAEEQVADEVESSWRSPTPDELEALDSMGDKGEWEVDGRRLKLTNLNKVLFPARDHEEPVTKRALVRYYVTIAPVILPYLVSRSMNMLRYPNGTDRPGFWHKEVPRYAPSWLARWRYKGDSSGETKVYGVIDSVASLAWVANYAAVELHPWTSRTTEVQQPTWAFIDIDPGTRTSFEDVILLAGLYRSGLDHLGVVGLPKLTGKRGVHIWIPIARGYSFDQTRRWVEKLSRAVGATVPELVSWTWQKSERRGLARLDYTQNALNKTLVAPYSVRAAAGAPVSVPVEWDELQDPDLRSDSFTIGMLPERIAKMGDPYRRLLNLEQQLPDL